MPDNYYGWYVTFKSNPMNTPDVPARYLVALTSRCTSSIDQTQNNVCAVLAQKCSHENITCATKTSQSFSCNPDEYEAAIIAMLASETEATKNELPPQSVIFQQISSACSDVQQSTQTLNALFECEASNNLTFKHLQSMDAVSACQGYTLAQIIEEARSKSKANGGSTTHSSTPGALKQTAPIVGISIGMIAFAVIIGVIVYFASMPKRQAR